MPKGEPQDRTERERWLALGGRLGALTELLGVLDQLGDRIDDTASDEINLPILVQNWRDVHAWLEQASDEVKAEIALLKSVG